VKTLNETLEEIEARANAATEGPWHHDGQFTPDDVSVWSGTGPSAKFLGNIGERVISAIGVVMDTELADAEFIAHARTDVPKLLAMLRLAIEQRDTAYTCSWDKDLGSMIADDDLALLAVGRGENG